MADQGRRNTSRNVVRHSLGNHSGCGGVACHHGVVATSSPRISARIAAIQESATLAVDAKAKALKAAGENVIGFGAGEPDFPTPAHVVDAAVAACRDPRFHHYSPTPGLPELREAIAVKTKRDSGVDCTAAQVVVTNGGKHAVYNTFQVLCNEGDEVLLPAPYWTTYPETITLAGGVPVVLTTSEADGFQVTVEQLEAAWTPRTKALLFVSPSNPTGAVYPPAEVEAIARWALERGMWVVTDEIYEHLTYDGHVFSSMPGLVPEIMDQCVILNGVAKTYAMTGWRVGWMIGPPDVTAAATNLQSHSTSNVSNVAQAAALAAVSGDLERRGRDAQRIHASGPHDVRAAGEDRRGDGARAAGRVLLLPVVPGCARTRRSAGERRTTPSSSARSCSTWPRSRSFRARPSVHPATPGSRSRSATTTSARECAGSPSCSDSRLLSPPMAAARVLVSEPLAERGLDAMRAAGLDVDVQTDLSPEQLLSAIKGAQALVIRSATQVTAEVLEAATDLVVVGRAGIGLDNVDVPRQRGAASWS